MNKKSVRLEVTPAEMRYLRETEGLTNKQIAERLDCAPATVYRYIGKRSNAVVNAQAQNKPCPVPERIATGRYDEEPVVEVESTMEAEKKNPLFQNLRSVPLPRPLPLSSGVKSLISKVIIACSRWTQGKEPLT